MEEDLKIYPLIYEHNCLRSTCDFIGALPNKLTMFCTFYYGLITINLFNYLLLEVI